MTSLVEYINSWWITPEQNNDGTSAVPPVPPVPPDLHVQNSSSSDIPKEEPNSKTIPKPKEPTTNIVYLISVNDLLKVKLKPVKDVVPSPARNMPVIDKFQLHMLNQAHLKEILNVKLRPIPPRPIRKYEHRHPVLREMLEKVKRI